MNYDDMREWQRMEEQGDEYVPSTIAYTQADREELLHDCGGDDEMATWIMTEVMEKGMANRDGAIVRRLNARIAVLEEALLDAGIDPTDLD